MSLLTIPRPCRWIRHPLSRQVVDSMSPQHKGTSDGVEVSDCDRQALLVQAVYKSKMSTRVGQTLNTHSVTRMKAAEKVYFSIIIVMVSDDENVPPVRTKKLMWL